VARLKAWLSDKQKRRARRIAREKGLTCPECGSSEPVPKDEVQAHPDGGANVLMRCAKRKSARTPRRWPSCSLPKRRKPSAYTLWERAQKRPDAESGRKGYITSENSVLAKFVEHLFYVLR
jgi:hypothetical protein